MNLNTLFPLPAWLTAYEKKRYNKMKRPFLTHARDLGIKMDPFLLAQINDFLIGQLLLARAEMKLQSAEEIPENLIEKLFKHREKLGKMRQELSAAFEIAAEKNHVVAAHPLVQTQSDLPTAPQHPTEGLQTALHNSDQTDPTDLPEKADLPQCSPPSPPSHPENPFIPVENSPSPKNPFITPNTVAAYMTRQKAERERLRSLLLPPVAKAAAA